MAYINVAWCNNPDQEQDQERQVIPQELSATLFALIGDPRTQEILVHRNECGANKYTLFSRTTQGNWDVTRETDSVGEFWAPERYDADTEWLAACRRNGIHSIFEPDMTAQLAALRVR